jgi:hypothetical protein
VTSHGLELPIDTGDDRAVKHPASNKVHYEIGQFAVSVLPKLKSHEVHPPDIG